MHNSAYGFWRQGAVVLALIIWFCAGSAGGRSDTLQQPEAGAGPASKVKPKTTGEKHKWSVKALRKGGQVTIRLQAADAPLAEMATELSRQLNIPVLLSPVMKTRLISLDQVELPLESALRLLAPQVYLDRFIVGGLNSTQYVAVYLSGFNENEWLSRATVQGSSSQVMMMEGDTDDLFNPPAEHKEGGEEHPIQVSFARNKLTVRAHKQPLAVVLSEIARVMNIPLDIQHVTNELVDLNFSGLAPEQVMLLLPPSVSLYDRMDVLTTESTPLRLMMGVTGPNKTKP